MTGIGESKAGIGGGTKLLVVSRDRAALNRAVLRLLRLWGDSVSAEGIPSRLPFTVEFARPAVVLMDGARPTDLTLLEELLAEFPLPVVVLTRPGSPKAEEFLRAGAVAVRLWSDLYEAGETLLNEVRVLSQARIVRRLKTTGRTTVHAAAVASTYQPTEPSRRAPTPVRPCEPLEDPKIAQRVVVIGGSSGAPNVLRGILQQLPPSLGACVLVVQHHHEGFSEHFAAWLDGSTEGNLPVILANDRQPLYAGTALFAPAGRHLIVKADVGCLDDGPPVRSSKPSVDVLFRSAAQAYGDRTLGVVLSGMGRDGSDGAKALVDAGGWVVVQSEETCGIFGMPRAVIEAGLANEVLPPDRIVEAILGFAEEGA